MTVTVKVRLRRTYEVEFVKTFDGDTLDARRIIEENLDDFILDGNIESDSITIKKLQRVRV